MLVTFTAYAGPPFPEREELFEGIRKEIALHKEIDSNFAEVYLAEIKNLHEHKNPEVDPSIEYVFVLSGRSSYLKEPIDIPNIKDPADDHNRMTLGIDIAKKVAANRSQKSTSTIDDIQKNGPQIIYNGTPKHNEALKRTLAQIDYPQHKLSIFELKSTEWNTRGQFKCLKRDSPLSHTSVAIVTHAYHFPRVARMIDSKWHPFGPNTKIFFYLVDRELKAPGVKEDLIGEIKRIPIYISQGDLKTNISENIHF